jgi:hypothetical protein
MASLPSKAELSNFKRASRYHGSSFWRDSWKRAGKDVTHLPIGLIRERGRRNMRKEFERVYQFIITLEGIEPPIWRRIQVPETYTFWDLHVAIQDAMGWTDSHLHLFRVKNPVTGLVEEIGIPGKEFEDEVDFSPGWEREIARYFPEVGTTADYVYDFGDHWEHSVEMEGIFAREKGRKYPHCIDGRRACPPEDCGGVDGFHEFLETILVLGHENREEMLTWAGGKYDPRKFDPREVHFDDPRKRWKAAFQGN